MREIKCPKCGEIFEIEKTDYDEIVSQIRDDEFKKQIELVKSEIQARADKEIEAEKNKQMLSAQESATQFAEELKKRDETIAYLRNFRLTLSTKMLGESLEQHCASEFESLRALAFKSATFEKDNDSKTTGTKGDFIFRDYSESGVEYISIMFEMKNEAEDSTTKHKNEDFFKKLDKDRNDKGCEYAILVSMLEQESELYNKGIVDVSHIYPKMYVIRPQFFIPMITLLRNAAMETIKTKNELAEIQRRNIDITNFETALLGFKDACAYNYDQAKKKFDNAKDEIDKAIDFLRKVKDDLTGAEDNLRIASDKAERMTIRKLTSKSPSLNDEFKKLKKAEE